MHRLRRRSWDELGEELLVPKKKPGVIPSSRPIQSAYLQSLLPRRRIMAEPPTLSNEESVKKRAFAGLAIALFLIVAAIGGLVFIERRSADAPRPVAPVSPPLETPANTADTVPPPAPEVSRVPDSQAAPPAPASPPLAPATPAETTPPAAPVAAVPAKPAEHVPPPTQHDPPAAAAIPPTPKTTSAILKLEDAPIAPGKGYTVQMGVFNTYANADSLLAKLKERGVPAYTETRVVVGPFRTKQEAKKAAATLKDLGETAIVSPPKRSRSKK
ncbi:MAG: SPOR domain-containing protein [Betaproteobacteria bacterium]|nr:SPOR domain-containing protein [Betaproteobacteria bacterium]